MGKYYNKLTQEILEYPDDAAALFDVLERVPSERPSKKDDKVSDANDKTDVKEPVKVEVEKSERNAK